MSLYRRGKPNGRKGEKRPQQEHTRRRLCAVCGVVFKPKGEITGEHGSTRRRFQRYCSKACWEVRNPPIVGQCKFCGAKTERYSVKKPFCSSICRDRFMLLFGSLVHSVDTVLSKDLQLSVIALEEVRKEVNCGYSYNHQ